MVQDLFEFRTLGISGVADTGLFNVLKKSVCLNFCTKRLWTMDSWLAFLYHAIQNISKMQTPIHIYWRRAASFAQCTIYVERTYR